ncbi:MAG: D-alanyl-D-alanine carboxypeptidase family protein [Bradymonadaceae bacterium]
MPSHLDTGTIVHFAATIAALTAAIVVPAATAALKPESDRLGPPHVRMRAADRPADSPAGPPVDAADLAPVFARSGTDPAVVFTYFGLSTPDDCRHFEHPSDLAARRRRWERAVEVLAATHREFLHDWIIGVRAAPKRVRQIATRQRNCLLDALFRDATADGPPERISLPDSEYRDPVDAYSDHRWARRLIRRRITKSHLRRAASQAGIWRRKFEFRGRHFNRISRRAARKCGLPVGSTWKPERTRHRRCWFDRLTAVERQREILSASSAPGISRHHWGTEFDLFSLNPYRFEKGRRYAEEYRWMRTHANEWGYFQTYRRPADAYMPEPWHWSYYPIAEALRAYILDHPERIRAELNALWTEYERRFHRYDSYFDYARDHWPAFVHGVSAPSPELELPRPE